MNKGDLICVLALAILAAIVFFLFTPDATEARRLRENIQNRREYLEQLQEESREARRTIEQLKNDDPSAIEAIARDKFGYCREGEEIYQVDKNGEEGASAPSGDKARK